MTTVTYGNGLAASRHYGRRDSWRLSRPSGRLLSIVFLALVALLYIAQSTQGSTKQLDVQQFQSQADQLASQQGQLQLEATRLQSLKVVGADTASMNLEPVTNVEYLSPTNTPATP